MTPLQDFLRSHGTLADLRERFAIQATRHPRYPDLVLFKYNQIESPFSEPIVRVSRGIILNESRDWEVVARPFDKFFNHGEPLAAPIDWRTARVQEKIDGSLLVLYHHDGQWQVSSSGTPDAGGNVGTGAGTGAGSFSDLFWSVFRQNSLPLPPDPDLTVMFELTAPENRVVVRQEGRRLTLIGLRDRRTGLERPIDELAGLYPIVRSFPLQTIEDVLGTFDDLDPLAQEGYVIVDGRFHRIKVKHPGYVRIHHLKDGVCPRRILEIVRAGESEEILAHFPEFRPEFDATREKYERLVARIEADYEALRAIPVQKDFALEALERVHPGALFAVRSGKAKSVPEFLARVPVRGLMDILGLRDAPPTLES